MVDIDHKKKTELKITHDCIFIATTNLKLRPSNMKLVIPFQHFLSQNLKKSLYFEPRVGVMGPGAVIGRLKSK